MKLVKSTLEEIEVRPATNMVLDQETQYVSASEDLLHQVPSMTGEDVFFELRANLKQVEQLEKKLNFMVAEVRSVIS